MTFNEARELYATARFMRDDLPDGMWDDLKDLSDDYRESDKDDDAKAWFIEGIESIMLDWGFPITV